MVVPVTKEPMRICVFGHFLVRISKSLWFLQDILAGGILELTTQGPSMEEALKGESIFQTVCII